MSKVIKPTQAYIDESRAKVLLEKWGPVLDYNSANVAPIEDDHTRLNTAMLLENQEQWCIGKLTSLVEPEEYSLVVLSMLEHKLVTCQLQEILHMPQAMHVFLRSSFR